MDPIRWSDKNEKDWHCILKCEYVDHAMIFFVFNQKFNERIGVT